MKAGFMYAPCLAEEQNTLHSERMTIGMLLSTSKQCPQCTESSTAAPVGSISYVGTELSHAVMKEGPHAILIMNKMTTFYSAFKANGVSEEDMHVHIWELPPNCSPSFAEYEGVPVLSGDRSGHCAYPLMDCAVSLVMASFAVFNAAASTTAGSRA